MRQSTSWCFCFFFIIKGSWWLLWSYDRSHVVYCLFLLHLYNSDKIFGENMKWPQKQKAQACASKHQLVLLLVIIIKGSWWLLWSYDRSHIGLVCSRFISITQTKYLVKRWSVHKNQAPASASKHQLVLLKPFVIWGPLWLHCKVWTWYILVYGTSLDFW